VAPFSSSLATYAQFDTFITKGVDMMVVASTNLLGAATNAQRAIEAGIFLSTALANPFGSGFETGVQSAQYISKNAPTLIVL
jgi:ribose transport system substrate-binding protein